MIYASIATSKLNHFVAVVSLGGEVFVESFQFSNDQKDFRSLSLLLDKYDREQLLIGFESTAHYSIRSLRTWTKKARYHDLEGRIHLAQGMEVICTTKHS